jgi:ribosomal protein L29
VERKNEIQSTISELNETKSKIEKGLIKVEAQNMMGEFDSPEIYKGVKRNLSSQLNTIKVKIESAQTELDQLGNHQLWFDWIDQFANEFTSTNNFTPEKKRHLVNGVVKDILVSYDQAQKLHRVRVNFRLPVLRSVGEILRANNAVLKRGANSPKESQTLENTGAPETVRSALLYRKSIFSHAGFFYPRK